MELNSAVMCQEVELRAHVGHWGRSPRAGQVVTAEVVLLQHFHTYLFSKAFVLLKLRNTIWHYPDFEVTVPRGLQ